MQMRGGWWMCAEPVLLTGELRGLELKLPGFMFHTVFFGWGFGTLQWFRLSSDFILGDSMSSSPLSLQFPSQSIKIQVRREYREAPTTPLTLRSLNLNWPNELAIGEALVTAYWCVHACVHARTPTPSRLCEIYCDNKILSQVVCFFPSLSSVFSFLSNNLFLTVYTKIQ